MSTTIEQDDAGETHRGNRGLSRFLGSIRARLFIFVLIAISPLALFQLQTLRDAREDRIGQARSVAAAEAQLGAASYGETVEKARMVLGLISRTPQVAVGDARICGAFLRGVEASGDVAGDIRVLDEEMRVICAADDALVGRSMAFARDGSDTPRRYDLSGFVLDDEGEPESYVTLADPSGRLYVAVLDGAWFRRFAGDLRGMGRADVALVDGRGATLAAFGDDPLLMNGERLTGSAALSADGARIVVSYDKAAVLADIDQLALRGYTVLVGLLVIVAAAGYFTGQRLLVAPIDDLRRVADSFAAGDFSARTAPRRFNARSEFAVLALAFNRMACALEERRAALDAAQERLDVKEAELVAANRRLDALAHSDPLTGLANRRRFDACLETEWDRMAREGEPIAVIAIDIDHFKLYNDNYGHPAGDRCLKQVADALSIAALRPEDLAARCGGEEFAILLPGLPPEHLTVVAEIVRTHVFDRNLAREDTPLGRVTVSVGAALVYPSLGGSPEFLRVAADRALYEAKNAGRNRSVAHLDAPPVDGDRRLRVAL